jgi:hypothetical protein
MKRLEGMSMELLSRISGMLWVGDFRIYGKLFSESTVAYQPYF